MEAFISGLGVWTRNVPWIRDQVARTDIPSSVLHAENFREAHFRIPDGSHISISADELRKALHEAPTRRNGTIVGPFNIDVESSTVFGKGVVLDRDIKAEANPDFALMRQLENDLIDDGVFKITSIEDARTTALRAVIQRRGQAGFRASILEAYDYRCAITDCDVEDVLEAAHIVPYKGEATNHVQNGLLLRADMHVLFDLYLICVKPVTLEILISKKIGESKFAAALAGKKLREPSEFSQRPSVEAMTFHFSEMQKRERSL
jgi:hypothetical protein